MLLIFNFFFGLSGSFGFGLWGFRGLGLQGLVLESFEACFLRASFGILRVSTGVPAGFFGFRAEGFRSSGFQFRVSGIRVLGFRETRAKNDNTDKSNHK